jgi:hypothetical protein
MLFRPDLDDFRVIGRFTGKVIYGIGFALLAHVPIALALREINEAYAFLMAAAIAVIFGAGSQILLRTRAALTASHGLATVALGLLALIAYPMSVPAQTVSDAEAREFQRIITGQLNALNWSNPNGTAMMP